MDDRALYRGIFTWPLDNWRAEGHNETFSNPHALRLEVTDHDNKAEIMNMVAKAKEAQEDESIGLFDIGKVVNRYWHWQECFPEIKPFYAVKVYDDPVMISTLARLGTGFDCASKAEIDLVLSLGVLPANIIFANTIKFPSHLRYAKENGISYMTFDNEEELLKVKEFIPTAKLVVRLAAIKVGKIQVPIKDKFGCSIERAIELISRAKQLKLNVVGVSFHVGSGCDNPDTYIHHVQMAKQVFEAAKTNGVKLELLDIGGGMVGHTDAEEFLRKMARKVKKALADFPSGVKIIAEPGRYFAESALTVAASVVGKRIIKDVPPAYEMNGGKQGWDYKDMPVPCIHKGGDPSVFQYYLSESIYNCLLMPTYYREYDFHHHLIVLGDKESSKKTYPSRLWGPTCDSLDMLQGSCNLPELAIGDWLAFRDVGCYTLCMASNFNGFPFIKPRRIINREVWESLKNVE